MTKTKKVKENGFWERNRKSEGYLLKRTIMNISVSVVRFILLFGLCFLILQPIFNKISVSFMEEKDLFNLANRVPFDDRVNHKAEMSDLNITLIQNYLKEVKSSLWLKNLHSRNIFRQLHD